eukprot:1617787-Alexandrium_andersonii.AAC.1
MAYVSLSAPEGLQRAQGMRSPKAAPLRRCNVSPLEIKIVLSARLCPSAEPAGGTFMTARGSGRALLRLLLVWRS